MSVFGGGVGIPKNPSKASIEEVLYDPVGWRLEGWKFFQQKRGAPYVEKELTSREQGSFF